MKNNPLIKHERTHFTHVFLDYAVGILEIIQDKCVTTLLSNYQAGIVHCQIKTDSLPQAALRRRLPLVGDPQMFITETGCNTSPRCPIEEPELQ
jgi:hypothetical protein